jgi:hypothetical protein
MDQWALITLVTVLMMNALLMSLKLEERMQKSEKKEEKKNSYSTSNFKDCLTSMNISRMLPLQVQNELTTIKS